jgi:ABC-type lipoprotein export system ATPase subunit
VGRAPDRAVIVVTHDSRVFHYGDRIAELTDGRIVGIRAAPTAPLHPLGMTGVRGLPEAAGPEAQP